MNHPAEKKHSKKKTQPLRPKGGRKKRKGGDQPGAKPLVRRLDSAFLRKKKTGKKGGGGKMVGREQCEAFGPLKPSHATRGREAKGEPI